MPGIKGLSAVRSSGESNRYPFLVARRSLSESNPRDLFRSREAEGQANTVEPQDGDWKLAEDSVAGFRKLAAAGLTSRPRSEGRLSPPSRNAGLGFRTFTSSPPRRIGTSVAKGSSTRLLASSRLRYHNATLRGLDGEPGNGNHRLDLQLGCGRFPRHPRLRPVRRTHPRQPGQRREAPQGRGQGNRDPRPENNTNDCSKRLPNSTSRGENRRSLCSSSLYQGCA